MNDSQSRKIVVLLLAVLALAFGVGLVVFSKGGLLHLKALKAEQSQLKAKNSAIAGENENLYREIDRLKKDTAYIEFLAKKRLGMVKPDEFIIEFDEKRPGGAQETGPGRHAR
jgi:cell division protein FtsB